MRLASVLLTLVLGTATSIAGCGDLERTSPYDPFAPAEKQARSRVFGTLQLAGESDHQGVALELQHPARTYSVESRPDGSFEIAGVVPGTYQVLAHTRYFSSYAGTVDVDLGSEVELSGISLSPLLGSVAGSALARTMIDRQFYTEGGVFLSLLKEGSIRGGAAEAPGRTFRPAAVENAQSFSVVSLPDGSFLLTGVPAGVYVLIATGDGGATSEVGGITVTGEEGAPVEVAPIVLEPLTGYLDIIGTADGAEDEQRTATPVVKLRPFGNNAQTMALGTSTTGNAAGCSFGTPIAYAAEVTNYTLPGGDGVKTVCVRYFSKAGLQTPALTDSILLDTTGPEQASAAIVATETNGERFVTRADGVVTLQLAAADALGKVSGLKVANGSGDCTAALDGVPEESFTTVKTWTLANPGSGIESARTVCVGFRDEAGNWSAPVSDTVRYDTALVAPSLAANLAGEEGISGRTRIPRVELLLTGVTADVAQMIVSNDASFANAGWLPVGPPKFYFLTSGDGVKTVYVKVRDRAGNESSVLQPQITLDQSGPETPVLALNDVDSDGFALSSTTVELRWTTPSASDLTSFQIERYVEGVDQGFEMVAKLGANTTKLIDDVTATSGAMHYYRIRAADDLGNVSSYSTVLTARPFEPVASLQQLRGDSEARYFLTPRAGTYMVSTDWLYDYPFPSDAFRDQLGFNVLSWSRSASFGGFNDRFAVRTANIDNSLVYESRFRPRHDERGYDGLTLGAGSGPSLGVDANGKVHIVYSNAGIFYATNESGTWTPDPLYATISVNAPRAAFASDGDAVMPYGIAIAFGPVPLSVRDGATGVWSGATFGDSVIYNPAQMRVVMDAAGNAYFVYGNGYDSVGGVSQQGIRMLTRYANGTWSAITARDTVAGTIAALSIARGTSRTSFAYMAGGNLRYGYRTDVGGNAGPYTLAGAAAANATAIGVKTYGDHVIAYVESATNDLKVWDQSSGTTTTIHTNAAEPVMAVGSDNTVYLAFRTASAPNLMFYHNASGTWTGRTLVADGDQGYAPSIALGPDGRIHIAYGDNLNGQLGYLSLEPPIAKRIAPWQTEKVDAQMDASGNIHVAYRRTSTGSLYYGRWDGTTFSSTLLDSDLSLGLEIGPSLALDAAGKVHIVYSNEADTALRYATNASGAWQVQQAHAASQYSSPRLAIQGSTVHILASGNYVRGSYNNWTAETIAGFPMGNGDIAVADDGTVHVVSYPHALADIGDLVHRYRSGTSGPWTTGFADTGWYDHPALRVHDGKVHIVAQLSGDAVHIQGSGGTYTRRTIEASNDVGAGVRFLFDAAGKLHLVYGDETSNTIRYATDALTGSIQSIELAKTATFDENSLFLKPDGSPVVLFGNGDVVLVEGFKRELAAETVGRTTAY